MKKYLKQKLYVIIFETIINSRMSTIKYLKINQQIAKKISGRKLTKQNFDKKWVI